MIQYAILALLVFAAIPIRAAEPAPLDQLTRQLDEQVPAVLAAHHTPGASIAIVRDRKIVWARGYGLGEAGTDRAVTVDTMFEAASMSKPLFALAVLKLVEERKLDLDRPLVEYLEEPYLPDEPLHEKITARMVLQHTCGFPNWRKGGWRGNGPLAVGFEPGAQYCYSGEGFWYLQQVIEKIVDEPMAPWIDRLVLKPLDMTHSAFAWPDDMVENIAAGHDADGNVKANQKRYTRENAAFSLFTTPSDYAKFLIAMMPGDDGEPQVVSRDSLTAMLEPAVRSDKPNEWRGLGWVIVKQQGKLHAQHSGNNGTGFRCYSRFNPVGGDGFVVMTNGARGDKAWATFVELAYPGGGRDN